MNARNAADIIHDWARGLINPFLNDEENAKICEALADINQEMSADLASLMHDVFCFGHMVGVSDMEQMQRQQEQEDAERASEGGGADGE